MGSGWVGVGWGGGLNAVSRKCGKLKYPKIGILDFVQNSTF